MLHSRMKRVNEEYQHHLAEIFAWEMNDPRMKLVTPVSVKVSPDLSEAVVLISVMEDDTTKAEEVLHVIEGARGYIKKLMAGRIQLKRQPNPHFKLDTTLTKAFGVFKLLHEIEESGELKPESEEIDEQKKN
ncbi:TPA: 30S ribosome-binding factor RbfA [Candidatus Sumerlaeota bacterium]|jgi:ribosome-binding factor A|nr:30S ribosome-binding factor RbfA [Candidatus Sumerlaeota bacterium]